MTRGSWIRSLFLLILLSGTPSAYGYSVLTHESIIDSVWKDSIEKLLRRKYPNATEEELREAHAYTYGGCVVHDMGYYPFGSHFFTDLIHYTRSGDFVVALLRNAQSLDEYAFALGTLAHYMADNYGHRLAVNLAVPMLYEKLRRRYGDVVTYAENPAAHIATEFGFDVLLVAKSRYSPDAYHDFIGFEVSKPLLERAFRQTYDMELDDVFGNLDIAIGTYRKSVSSIIPKMTRVAWDLKSDEIRQDIPGVTRDKFLYNLSRSDYEKSWGTNYRRPGILTKLLALLIRIIPKIGPFRALAFHVPTPEAEKLFMNSFNQAVDRYRAAIAQETAGGAKLENLNFDLGRVSKAGDYEVSDKTYAKLVDRLASHQFTGVSGELRSDILAYYKNWTAGAEPKKKSEKKLSRQLRALEAIGVGPVKG